MGRGWLVSRCGSRGMSVIIVSPQSDERFYRGINASLDQLRQWRERTSDDTT